MPTTDDLLAVLPDTFGYSEAVKHMSERHLRRLITDDAITVLSRGLYRKNDWIGDDDLIEIAAKSPRATLCLRSALVRHGLIDDIPAVIDVAIPRGSWTPRMSAPVHWRHFDTGTFTIGRERLDIGAGRAIGIYAAERSIVDAFRLKHLDGSDLAIEALKQWLRQGGQPSQVLATAQAFPRTRTALRGALEVLL